MASYEQNGIQGTVSQNASDGTSSGWQFFMDVSYEQNSANNQTTFTVHQYLKSRYYRYNGGYDYENTIGSESTGVITATTPGTVGTSGAGPVTVDIVPKYTATIDHRSDGTISSDNKIKLSSYFYANYSSAPGTCKASVTLTIPKINRGLVYVNDGEGNWSGHAVFIFDGTDWVQHAPYVFENGEWNEIG